MRGTARTTMLEGRPEAPSAFASCYCCSRVHELVIRRVLCRGRFMDLPERGQTCRRCGTSLDVVHIFREDEQDLLKKKLDAEYLENLRRAEAALSGRAS